MIPKSERRFFKIEVRAKKAEDDSIIFEGYSAVFDRASENLGWNDWAVFEYIQQGAFTKALLSSDCRALFNHDSNFILGRQTAKTLEIVQDETGLKSTIHAPNTQYARDLAVSVERGDIREQSFCFTVLKDVWEEDKTNKTSKRTIIEIGELIDVSLVTFPAYPDTDVMKRSYGEFKDSVNTDFNRSANASDEKRKLEIELLNLSKKWR